MADHASSKPLHPKACDYTLAKIAQLVLHALQVQTDSRHGRFKAVEGSN